MASGSSSRKTWRSKDALKSQIGGGLADKEDGRMAMLDCLNLSAGQDEKLVMSDNEESWRQCGRLGVNHW